MIAAAAVLDRHGADPGPRRRLLNAGCGNVPLQSWLGDFDETRLDIDPDHRPDIIGDMADLGDIGPFDAIYCSHALEHLTAENAIKALRGFHPCLPPEVPPW